jgi:predicted amidohydrolase
MKIAAAAYPIDWHNRWNDYVGKLRVWVRTAKEQGAELLVFPEYAAMEISSLGEEKIAGDLVRSVDAVNARLPDMDALHASLAREFGVHISAGSAPVRLDGGRVVNRVRIFAPDGSHGHQDKQIMTPFERDEWIITSGDPLRVFDSALGRIGVLICYDAEFPLLARAMVEAGAEILLVPSCTDTQQGFNRVRIAAMARALEGQCIVVQATTVGEADWLAAADRNVGVAGIFAPPDGDFAESGVLASGKPGDSGWTYAEADLETVRAVRTAGTVRNVGHWEEQRERLGAELEVVSLLAAQDPPVERD